MRYAQILDTVVSYGCVMALVVEQLADDPVRILQWATLNDAYLLLGHYIGYDGCRICLSLVKPEFESSQTEPEVGKSKQ